MLKKKIILRLHWRLFFPLMGLLWLIIGISMAYFVNHEKERMKESLENRLMNVNNTVIEAYEQGADIQRTVNFIRLFTGKTTLDPLRLTVYNNDGQMVADNPAATIELFDDDGKPVQKLKELIEADHDYPVEDVSLDNVKFMICSKTSADGRIHSFAALPYQGEVSAFLSYDPMVWIVIITLGVILSIVLYFGVKGVCNNVYALRDIARAIAMDQAPKNMEAHHFSKDELGDVTRDLFEVYRDKIRAEQEKMHHERQIGMNVSHELRTPVAIIKGYLDTVINDNGTMDDATKTKFLLRAQQNVDRLTQLISDVSTVMRLQENGGSIKCEPINFHVLTESIAEDMAQGRISGDMELDINVPDTCVVNGHESLLTNAMLNLIYNAVQHSEGTKMRLDWTKEEGGFHTFTFADNGKGVEPEHIARLFDLFYRVDNGRTRKSGGSGLGLPLVQRIINAMGGTITVANAPEGGLVFTFTLPKA